MTTAQYENYNRLRTTRAPALARPSPFTQEAVAVLEVEVSMSVSSNTRIVRISKEMSKVLRHQPPAGAMDPQGWVDVPVLLGVLQSKPTYEELVTVVQENDKVGS
jgi:RNA:NAD 2'-phosphotransferase (TPT1/KptA family)